MRRAFPTTILPATSMMCRCEAAGVVLAADWYDFLQANEEAPADSCSPTNKHSSLDRLILSCSCDATGQVMGGRRKSSGQKMVGSATHLLIDVRLSSLNE
jgi:hypothetical protein